MYSRSTQVQIRDDIFNDKVVTRNLCWNKWKAFQPASENLELPSEVAQLIAKDLFSLHGLFAKNATPVDITVVKYNFYCSLGGGSRNNC